MMHVATYPTAVQRILSPLLYLGMFTADELACLEPEHFDADGEINGAGWQYIAALRFGRLHYLQVAARLDEAVEDAARLSDPEHLALLQEAGFSNDRIARLQDRANTEVLDLMYEASQQ